jgi:hypothetical protein
MIKGNEGGTVEVKYEIKRAAGGTSYSDTLKFSVGVALDLKEPKIKQAPNDSSLDPLNAQSALTAVINYDGMLVGDKIIVRWIGATGTLPAGSHTTDPWPVTTVGPQEIPLAVSVLAFNLDKSITLNYSVTRGTQDPKDSRTRTLAVLQLRVDLSHSPKIIQAAGGGDGTELDVSTLTAAATLRSGFWPHIASGQRVWMEVQGTKKDDTEYKRVVWRGPGNAVNETWMSNGYLDVSLALADLQSLKDLSPLNVSFMATPDRSTDENLALSFPLRTYTVKNVVEVLPTIESIKESPGGDEIPHGSPTVKTAVTLSGKATPGKKIDLANNGVVMPNTEIQVDSKGEWTFQLTGLVAGTTYKLSARRKDGTLSDARDVVVVALVVPTLDNVLDDRNEEVLEGTITVSTDLILKGTASLGQQINIRDGSGSGSATRGTATANLTTGIWECPITVPLGVRRLYAEACYPSNPLYSDVRNLTVTEDIAPTIDSVIGTVSGNEIPQNGTTGETAVTLSGVAAKGQQIEVFDGATSKGKATADPATGKWELPITGLSAAAHSFKAKALYAPGAESTPPRTLTVAKAFIIDTSQLRITVSSYSIVGTSLDWFFTGNDIEGTYGTRYPTSGVPPYTFTSENSAIASVDQSGRIRGEGKGTTAIIVTDAYNRSARIEVVSPGMVRLLYNPNFLTTAEADAWVRSVGSTHHNSNNAHLAKYAPRSIFKYHTAVTGAEITTVLEHKGGVWGTWVGAAERLPAIAVKFGST